MLRIRLQQLEILVRECSDVDRQSAVSNPEVGRCVMLQSGVVRPDACSASARAASLSSRPPATSVSSWRSQCAASNSANQPRNLSSSAAERALMALSICSTFPMIRTLANRSILRPAPSAAATGSGRRSDRYGGNQTCEANRRLWPDASDAGTETAVVRVPAAPGEAADEGGCRPSAGTAFEGCRNRASPIDYWVGAPESGSALVGLSMSLSVRPGTHPRTLADKG